MVHGLADLPDLYPPGLHLDAGMAGEPHVRPRSPGSRRASALRMIRAAAQYRRSRMVGVRHLGMDAW
jgi:hypothetical protein